MLPRVRAMQLRNFLSYLIGLIVALLIFSIILLAMGFNPLLSIQAILYGSFGTVYGVSETFVRMAPLLLSALAFLVAFRARFFNIGVEGQLYIGALTTYLVASQLKGLPSGFAIPLVILASFIGGVVWLMLPLILKIALEINEIFTTVVMNFIATTLISWLCTGPLRDPNAINPQTRPVPSETWLPVLIPKTRFHAGIVLSLLLAFITYLILFKTTLGYKIRAVGLSPLAAKQGGINLPKVIISVGVLSGGLGGLAGMVEVLGAHHLLITGFSPGFGYVGIAIAALGGFHPIATIFASVFFAVLLIGGETMQRGAGVPVDIIYVLQAVLVLSILIIQKWIVEREMK